MNSSKSSRFSLKSHKPDNFRVMMKQRTNRKEPLRQSKRVLTSNQIQLDQSLQTSMIRTQNFTEMKDYVKNRMKTQYGDHFGRNRLTYSRLNGQTKTPETLSRKGDEISSPLIESELNSPLRKSLIQLDSSRAFQSKNNNQKNQISQANFQSNNQTLDSMQKKMEDLLDRRLKICFDQKNVRNELVQKELQKMIGRLRDLRKQDPETADSHIAYFDKKVKLFQRLMAQSLTEAEIIKKDFLRKIANKSKHRRLNTDISTTSNSRLSMNRYNHSPVKTAIINSSLSKQTYKTPQLAAYKIYKHENPFFNADRHRQPLPRSSYNREYLICPLATDKEVIPKDNEFIGNNNSPNLLKSLYQMQYLPKEVEKINIKELDACKNKIKDVSVLYGRKVKSNLSPSSYNLLLSKIRMASEKKNPVLVQPKSSYKQLLSESRRQYKKTEDKAIQSQIRHKNLHKLKYQYRKKLCI